MTIVSKTRSRPHLLVGLIFALAGCAGGESDADHDDEAGHAIPAHKPRDLPAGVAYLREFLVRAEKSAAGGDRSKALDVARWLPEVAADGDMPETEWNVVDAKSAALARLLERPVLDQAGAAEAAALVGELSRLVDAADPAWFANGAPLASAPAVPPPPTETR